MERELNFDVHLQNYNSLFGVKDGDKTSELALYSYKQACYMHMLAVWNPLMEWSMKSQMLTNELKNEQAKYFMRFGVGRRALQLFYAYRSIVSIASVNRTQPIKSDEQASLSRDINILYLHIRGMLDNFAWCFMYEKGLTEKDINPRNVSFFSKQYAKHSSLKPITDELSEHKEWESDLKSRRDPVAHRIPLSVPPAIVTSDEAKKHIELQDKHLELAARGDFEGADASMSEIDQLGTFQPCFVHHPEESVMPIYPTIPSDIGHLIKIGEVLEKNLVGS